MNYKTQIIALDLRTMAAIPGKILAQLARDTPTLVGLHQNEGKINEPNNYYNLGWCHGFRAR